MKKEVKAYPGIVRSQFVSMGTNIDIQIVVSSEREQLLAKKDLAAAATYYGEFEKIFSRFDCESELSMINRKLGEKHETSHHLLEVARRSLRYYDNSEQLFDPRILDALESSGYDKDFKDIFSFSRSRQVYDGFNENELSKDLLIDGDKIQFNRRMDFSGIVKGYVTDLVSNYLKKRNWKNFLVDSGGDMFFAGIDKEGKPWLVDIEGISNQKVLFQLREQGVATSGIGKRKWEKAGLRFHHLVNPKNLENFSFELKSVTVIAPTVEMADVLAKVIFIMGWEKGSLFAEKKALACIILNYKGQSWVSSEFRKYLK